MNGTAVLARRAVARSLFPPTGLAGAVTRLGFVQLDPIRAPARAHDLVLRQRVTGYRVGDLERAYSSLDLAEDHVHVYGVLPASGLRWLHPRDGAGAWRVEREHPRLCARILDHVAEHVTVHPASLQKALGRGRTVNGWGGQSALTTRLLEALHYRGKLRVAHRVGGVRVYALAPRPSPPLAPATRARAVLRLLIGLYAPLPEASLATLARMATSRTLAADERARLLDALLRSRTLVRDTVDGVRYVWPADDAAEAGDVHEGAHDQVRLLAPFDPLVWDRRRFAHLWGWEYRLEAYTPPARRRFGYYALPLLWRDRVVGWANATVRDGALDVAVGHAVPVGRDPHFRRALDAEIARLEETLGVAASRAARRSRSPP